MIKPADAVSAMKGAWIGRQKLWKVFWLYGVSLGAAIALILSQIQSSSAITFLPVYVFAVCWWFWVSVSLWNCAFNVEWRGWGYAARVLVAFPIVGVIISFGLVLMGVA
jgi:hypothetical protein